ncbi:transposase IS4 [Candidatus Magnetoovum chiemensis]|nr:transposase IS4 [Candidatus Magnetoovum chiemensis]
MASLSIGKAKRFLYHIKTPKSNKSLNSLQNVHGFSYVVADSAFYTEKTLKIVDDKTLFISRVPSTLKSVKELLKNVDVRLMDKIDDNYSCQEVCSIYGEVKQRWIIVYSHAACKSDIKTLNRQMLKSCEGERKAFEKLCRHPFVCREDAQLAWEKFQKTLDYIKIFDIQIREDAHYAERGKPKKGNMPERVDYLLTGSAASCLHKRAGLLRLQGMFVLATNDLDTQRLPASAVLSGYKGQSHVETGFRFLKNPEFLASSLFLKRPERIMALLMIMTLCLMVYAALEYSIRQKLQQHRLTVLNQAGKKTDKPTARWIFHCFVGIHILFQNDQKLGVLNLHDRHWEIINLLGYQEYYT